MTTDKKTQRRQKAIVFLSSFILFGVTYYGHGITLQRVNVIEHGQRITTEVTKTTSRGTNKTFYVTIENLERNGGQNFGDYADINVGDKVTVKYLPNVKYVVAEGVNDYRNMKVLQYLLFVTSFILFLLPLLSWTFPEFDNYCQP